MTRKIKLLYYFTVEGASEKRYLEYLQTLINNASEKYSVVFKITEDKSARDWFKKKQLAIDTYAHVWDRESDNQRLDFEAILRCIKENATATNVYYCYSNLSFELWLLLHKAPCFSVVSNKNKYLEAICKLYKLKIKSHKDLTRGDNFKLLLRQITLEDVKTAINNAKQLRQNRIYSDCKRMKFKISSNEAITYFVENPDTLVHEVIKKILLDCELLTL